MKKTLLHIYAILLLTVIFLPACKEETVEFDANICKQMPVFVTQLGFPAGSSFFSTTDTRKMGLVLKQSQQVGNPNAPIIKEYQHPSWQKGGWLAPIVLDEKGNIYVSPAPFVSILNNSMVNSNTVFKVDTKTGEMNEWVKLPLADSTVQNPFGIIAMVYLCEAKVLYVSTVAGSDRQNERGCIYAIDVATQKIKDQVTGTDAMGMGISYVEEKRKLYFGTGRGSDVFSVSLDKEGKFNGTPQQCFSIEGLGPRGDDKVRRIYNNKNGTLTIAGFEFNYNLVAPREKQETSYIFSFDEESNKWLFLK